SGRAQIAAVAAAERVRLARGRVLLEAAADLDDRRLDEREAALEERRRVKHARRRAGGDRRRQSENAGERLLPLAGRDQRELLRRLVRRAPVVVEADVVAVDAVTRLDRHEGPPWPVLARASCAAHRTSNAKLSLRLRDATRKRERSMFYAVWRRSR